LRKYKITESDIVNFINDNEIPVEFVDMFRIKDARNSTRIRLILRCKNGHTYEQYWDNFKKGHGCNKCEENVVGNNKYSKYNLEFVYKIIEQNNYELLNEYKNAGNVLHLRCKVCGDYSYKNFKHVLDGRKCRNCSGLKKKTTDEFKEIVNNLTDGEYELIGEYSTVHTKTLFLHKKCNTEYECTPANFLGDKRCPYCKSSKGEKEIKDFLIKNKLIFIQQFRFDDCRYTNSLPFDFAIFSDENKLLYLIEYDGEQHYKPVEYWGGEIELQNIKVKDKIKTDYCLKNNYKLIRIPYWEKNRIKGILEEELFCIKN
jgi:hypothetical protein